MRQRLKSVLESVVGDEREYALERRLFNTLSLLNGVAKLGGGAALLTQPDGGLRRPFAFPFVLVLVHVLQLFPLRRRGSESFEHDHDHEHEHERGAENRERGRSSLPRRPGRRARRSAVRQRLKSVLESVVGDESEYVLEHRLFNTLSLLNGVAKLGGGAALLTQSQMALSWLHVGSGARSRSCSCSCTCSSSFPSAEKVLKASSTITITSTSTNGGPKMESAGEVRFRGARDGAPGGLRCGNG